MAHADLLSALRSASCALALVGAAVAAPQAEVLLEVGDPLPGGETIRTIESHRVHPDRSWSAVVEDSVSARYAILDGVVARRPGDVIDGEQVSLVVDSFVTSEGRRIDWFFDSTPPFYPEFVAVDEAIVLRPGTLLSVPGLPADAAVDRISAVAAEGPFLLVVLRYGSSTPCGTCECAILWELDANGALTNPTRESCADNVYPGQGITSVEMGTYIGPVAVTTDGRVITKVESVTDLGFGLYEDRAIALEGTDALFQPGTEWAPAVYDSFHRSSFGGYATGSRIVDGSNQTIGVVVRGDLVAGERAVVLGGSPFVSSGTQYTAAVDSFDSEVVLNDRGELLFGASLDAGGDLLAIESPSGVIETLLESGVSTIDGLTVTGIAFEQTGALSMDPTGFYVGAVVERGGGRVGLVRVPLTIDLGQPSACQNAPNSTGISAGLRALGSPDVAANSVRVEVTALPRNSFGLVLVSRVPSFIVGPGGSAGNLCLGGTVGLLLPPHPSGEAGAFVRPVDLTSLPEPSGPVAALPGETWYFQCWHRDVVGGAAGTNFSRSAEVLFR
ncbi:MAG: hypothetical protein AAF726_08580 [Planctomycetota bacterium]